MSDPPVEQSHLLAKSVSARSKGFPSKECSISISSHSISSLVEVVIPSFVLGRLQSNCLSFEEKKVTSVNYIDVGVHLMLYLFCQYFLN